jgi:hypothetical protein
MKHILPIFFALFLFSCGNGTTEPTNDSTPSLDSTTAPSETGWKELTESWNESLNLRNASIMKSFYADSVLYYGDHLTSDEVVHRQQEYFALNTDYHQKITEYIDEIQQPDGSWLIKIIKQVTTNGKTVDYPASLVYANVNGIWKIVAESDDITDLNKAKNMQAGYAPAKTTIEGLVEENTTFGKVEGGDPKSDARIQYYALWSKHSLDVVANAEQEKNGLITEENVERIQLIGNEEQVKKLLNHKVRVTGTLNHASADNHYTKVVMNVELIEEVL